MPSARNCRPAGAIAAFLAALALAGCAVRPPHPEAFAFAAVGDLPYRASEEAPFDEMIARLSAEKLAFVVHVGDFIASSGTGCADAVYADRKRRLDASSHPLVLTPGDNDWADCRREGNGRKDPLERLAAVRERFFADDFSLGRTRMPLAVQRACVERGPAACACPGLPENRLWTKSGVVFVTVHAIGSNDNKGFDAANDAEQRCRALANAAWLDGAFRLAAGAGQRGLAIVTHVNPWSEKSGVHDALVARVAAGAKALAKPVLFVHGDTHFYQSDHPFRDIDGRTVGNLRRVEVFGSPIVGWVRVTVDPGDPALFSVSPQLPPGAP
jgi:hypothetical protein